MHSSIPPRSIAKKISIAVILSSGSLALLITLWQLLDLYRKEVDALELRLQQITSIQIPSLEDRLWVSDIEGIEIQAQGLLEVPGIQSVTISDDDKTLIELKDENQSPHDSRSFTLSYIYKDESLAIGRLDLAITLSEVYSSLVNRALGILLANSIKTFLVGILILFIFNRLVTRHLIAVSNHLNNLAYDDDRSELFLDRTSNSQNDELDVVVDSVNRMQNKIADDMDAIKESNKTLQEALKQMKEEKDKRNQLYGIVAHELRTPVSTIAMLSTDDNEDEWRSHKGTISIASTTLLDTIDDMRMLINPDLKRPIRYEKFRIEDFENQIVTSTQSIVSSSGFILNHRIDGDATYIQRIYETDTYRLRISVVNLIRNACLHSAGDEVDLTIKLPSSGADKGILEIFVSDNGVGIEEEIEKTLFEPEIRGKTQAVGTGLGLHISKTWIEEIGGSLDLIQARPGASFRITVPVSYVGSLSNAKSNAEYNEQLLREKIKRWRVLFVEDDMMLGMIGSKFMSGQVAHVELVSNGEDALALLKTEDFDLIITDFFMPRMNGDEFIKSARDLGFDGIIMGLSAATLGDQIDTMRAAGADSVMAKPISSGTFYRSLSIAVENRIN